MQTVTIESVVTGWRPVDVYERLKDSDVYVKFAPEQVKSVVTEPVDEPDEAITHWEIYFRNGLLCWSERDYYDDEKCTVRFEQIAGDFDVFEGDWVVSARGPEPDAEVLLTFTAHFDFGVPSLEAIIEPVAIRVLRQAMGRIIGKLFGGVILD
ncbi:type II toxin-antitoxin system RatA family toxin [Saccharothrix deserti]|uniref:type II toxin-antitoxin system RatA family toxin n=1 Tax=Saccharothrix deserti TaxID=2593674 RepID=UPI00131CB377|nr:SRPBCC family protein [Saccharothrix deserti]